MSIASNFPAIRPSLLLDFAGTRQLDPRITFTRASTATFYDQTSSVLAEQNLLTYSQQFDNAAWVKSGTTVTSTTAVAPDGTATAETISLSSLYAGPYQGTIYCLESTAYTLSVWLKWVSGNTSLSLSMMTKPNNQTYVQAVTVTSTWTRFVFTLTTAAGQNLFHQVIPVQDRNATGQPTVVNIWGAQLEQRSTVTAYTPTTTSAITNYIPKLQTAAAGVARFDCNPITRESLGLLLEESRTNVLTYSSDFTDASWTKQGSATVTANTNIAPDGTLTASTINLPTTADNVLKGFAIGSAGTIYVLSIWLAGTGTIYIGSYDNISAGQQTLITLTSTLTRYSFTFTFGAGSTDRRVYIANRLGSGSTTTSVIAWGAQLESALAGGAVPRVVTSYIPTVASSVTRAADAASMTGTNFSSWFNSAQGTLLTETNYFSTDYITRAPFIAPTSYNDSQIITANFYGNSGESAWFINAVYGTTTLSSPTISGIGNLKTAIAYKSGDNGGAINGVVRYTDSTAGVGGVTFTQLNFNEGGVHLDGYIKKIAYYPVRLTNTQLQALTIL